MKILTIQEIAQAWKVDESTVNRLVVSGKIQATRFGGQWRIKEADLNEYLKKRTTKVKIAS